MKRIALAAIAAAVALALPAAAAGVGSLARITVIDRTAQRELPVHWKDGRAYVAGHPGNEYQVRVRNAAGEDLLAVVSVDGVNVVTGQAASTAQGGYVLGPWRSMDVAGWRKSLEHTAAFYFTSLPDSYAARTGRPDDVGVIGVALFRRKRAEPPAAIAAAPAPFAKREAGIGSASPASPSANAADGAAESSARRAQADAPLGTGHGRIEDNAARWTSFDRASEHPVEVVTIRYDSTRNLLAQGILRPAPRPRDPNPFPGFVPDPVTSLPWGGNGRGG